MTMTSATIICDSVNTKGERITTMVLTYHRFIHSELMTHRVFSRNASSSRAIPVWRTVRSILSNPATPIHWGQNQKGMQAYAELEGWRLWAAKGIWHTHRYMSASSGWVLDKLGAHKQFANRLMEAHSYIRVVVTSTHWANFFALRNHEAADPHFQLLAAHVEAALQDSIPTLLQDGEWHIPFILPEERKGDVTTNDLIDVSVARCARTSYHIPDENGNPVTSTYNKDLDLCARLLGSVPLHASPAEHQAMADAAMVDESQWGNFTGWRQYRKMLAYECVADEPYDISKAEVAKDDS